MLLESEGIIFILLSSLLFVGSLFLKDKKLSAECMALVSMVQLFGLSRVRDIGLDFNYYSSLTGFSFYEMRFIPNRLADPFLQHNYSEEAIEAAAFAFGSQNFIVNFGSLFCFFLAVQLLLLSYLLYSGRVQIFKQLQDHAIYFWANIVIFGTLLCLLSLQDNSVSSDNLQYTFPLLFSFAVVIAYAFYFVYWVRNRLATDLYKLNNLCRVFGLLMLAYGSNNGILFINFAEIFFFVADLTFFRKEKTSLVLYVVEKVAFLVAFNASLLKFNHVALLVVAGLCFGVITAIKTFYVIRKVV